MTIALHPYQDQIIAETRTHLRCRNCGADKPADDFYMRKDSCKRRTTCRTCWAVKCDRWRQRNPQKRRAIALKYARANMQKIRNWKRRNRERSKQWDRNNPELMRSYKTAWKRRNPHEVLADVRRRQAAVLRAIPPWADRKGIAAMYRDARARGLELDHVVPLRHPLVCGFHCETNLRPVPSTLNRRKSNRYWPDMP